MISKFKKLSVSALALATAALALSKMEAMKTVVVSKSDEAKASAKEKTISELLMEKGALKNQVRVAGNRICD